MRSPRGTLCHASSVNYSGVFLQHRVQPLVAHLLCDTQRGQRRRRHWHRHRRGEDLAAAAVGQEVPPGGAAGHKAALAAKGLRQRAHMQVHSGGRALRLGGSAPAFTAHEGGVRFVHHLHSTVVNRGRAA
jgi:hypothetical protein